jgi:serine/threonine-protein kinase
VADQGDVLGDYELLERIGSGGMGVVFRARHTLLDRIDAIKVLRDDCVENPEFRQRFLREVRAAARVTHPNIVRVYGAGEVSAKLFLAMEYVPAADLSHILGADGALDPARAVAIIGQVAAALDAAHVEKLVHRDVKPANVLVADRAVEHAYLTDFGVSRFVAEDSGLTGTGVLGTPAYFAPERFVAGADLDHRSDQYSLACMAFECLTGSRPFTSEDVWAVITAHMSQEPPAASQLRPSLSPAVDAVLARGMAKAPEARYRSCAAFAVALREALGAPATGYAGRTDAFAGPTDIVRNTPQFPVSPPRKRWPVFAGIGVVLALALTAALVYGPLGKSTDSTEPIADRGGIAPTSASPPQVTTVDSAVAPSAASTASSAPSGSSSAPASTGSGAAPVPGSSAAVASSAPRSTAVESKTPDKPAVITTTTTVAPQPKATVSKGSTNTGTYCEGATCGHVHIVLSGFPAGTDCRVQISADEDGVKTFGDEYLTVNANGGVDTDMNVYYSWTGKRIWATVSGQGCPSITSNQYTWPG